MFPVAVNVLLPRVKPLLAVMVTAPWEVRVLSKLIVDPVEVRASAPTEVVLLALSDKAPAELKVAPLPSANTEEFAFTVRFPAEVLMSPFKLIPEFAVRDTAPAAVKLPVIVMLVGAFKLKPAVADISPEIALKFMDDALVSDAPLAKVILSSGLMRSVLLSESPFRLRVPAVVVILELTLIPLMAFASREENEESA